MGNAQMEKWRSYINFPIFQFPISKNESVHSPNRIEQGWSLEIRSRLSSASSLLRKEVIQPHLPVRLPCYDLAPVTGFTLGAPLLAVG